MIISYLLQPVHTNKCLEGINGIIIWSLSKCKVCLTAKCAVHQTSALFHGCIIGRSYLLEIVHAKCCQITIICPLSYLRIIILHQDCRQVLICCKQCVGCHNITSCNRNVLNLNVVLISKILLNPAGPIVVGNIRNTFCTSVINWNSQSHGFCKWLPICGRSCLVCHSRNTSCYHSTCH